MKHEQLRERFDVFISYSRKDLEVVRPIRAELENVGISCWIDIDGIESGDANFKRKVVPALDSCCAVLFVISVDSQKSEWTGKELGYASRHGKRIVPLRFNDAPLVEEFDFDYGGVDIIDWRHPEQRQKLIRDLKKWTSKGFANQDVRADGVLVASSANANEKIENHDDVHETGICKFRVLGLASALVCVFLVLFVVGGVVWHSAKMRGCARALTLESKGKLQGARADPQSHLKAEGTVVGELRPSELEDACKKTCVAGKGDIVSGGGLIIENGRILSGKEAEEAKGRVDQSVRDWNSAMKICQELLNETILLRRKISPFVQTGALATDDIEWIAASKRADGYLDWAFKYGKTPEAQIKERTAIRDGFLKLLERLEAELKRQVADAHDTDREGGTFVKRTIARAALELASLSEEDRSAAIVDLHRSIGMKSDFWYGNERNMLYDDVVDRIGREYDVVATEGNKLFNAGMHRPDEISSCRPDLVMYFYDIRHRVLNDIKELVAQGHTEKALLYYSSADRAFKVLHLHDLKRPDFSSVSPVGR